MPLQLLQIILPQASVAAQPEALGASDASANATATADNTATTPDPLLQPETEAVAQSESEMPQIMLLQQHGCCRQCRFCNATTINNTATMPPLQHEAEPKPEAQSPALGAAAATDNVTTAMPHHCPKHPKQFHCKAGIVPPVHRHRCR